MIYFGEACKALREYRGWSQSTVADKAGITIGFYGDVERGTRNCSLAVALQIAYALDVTLDFLTSDYYAWRKSHEAAITQENPDDAAE